MKKPTDRMEEKIFKAYIVSDQKLLSKIINSVI